MPQENFTFINRSIVGWGDYGSPNTGKPVNSDTTYVYTAAHYPLPYPPQGAHPAITRLPANTFYTREVIRLSDLLTARQGLSFSDRGIIDWGDSGTPNTGQPVNTTTSYIRVAALYPAISQGRPANTIYAMEYIRIADLLTAQQGLTFADRSTLDWGDYGSPNTGKPVNSDTTYVYTLALYPAISQGRPANTVHTREFIRLSDLLNAMR